MLNSLKIARNQLATRLRSQSFASANNFRNYEEFFASAKCDVVSNAPIMVFTDKILASDANQSSNLIVSKDVAAAGHLTSVPSEKRRGDVEEENKEPAIPPYGMDLQPTAKKHNLKISS